MGRKDGDVKSPLHRQSEDHSQDWLCHKRQEKRRDGLKPAPTQQSGVEPPHSKGEMPGSPREECGESPQTGAKPGATNAKGDPSKALGQSIRAENHADAERNVTAQSW